MVVYPNVKNYNHTLFELLEASSVNITSTDAWQSSGGFFADSMTSLNGSW